MTDFLQNFYYITNLFILICYNFIFLLFSWNIICNIFSILLIFIAFQSYKETHRPFRRYVLPVYNFAIFCLLFITSEWRPKLSCNRSPHHFLLSSGTFLKHIYLFMRRWFALKVSIIIISVVYLITKVKLGCYEFALSSKYWSYLCNTGSRQIKFVIS